MTLQTFNFQLINIMPKFDGTGPAGKGPKTGAQMGQCDDPKA